MSSILSIRAGGRLFDREIYLSVERIPDPVDLGVILIPAPAVPDALEACGRRGIPSVIIGSGGFRETGSDGEALEARCLAIARKHAMRVLGPNCIGYLDTHLPIDTTFLPLPGPLPGDIAFLSHSGAICEAVIDWAREQGFGFSRLVSLGNQMDLTEAELLAATAADEHTRVVAMYLEGVTKGTLFIEEAQRVSAQKPIVAIKVGRSARGRATVASHTGALAGEDRVYDAAFRKAGVLRADNSEEMFDWGRALAWCPLPVGARMAVLTNAGGPGAIAVDALDAKGLQIADLTTATIARMQDVLPDAASLSNPVDMLAGAGPMEYAHCLRTLLADDGVDGVMVILPPPPLTTADEVAGAIIPVIQSKTKPVVIALMGGGLIAPAADLFRQSHIPDYRFPERAASALSILVRRAEQLTAQHEEPETFENLHPQLVDTILENTEGEGRFLDASTSAALIAAYGINVAVEEIADSGAQAAQAAGKLGFPIAMKALSEKVTHKSDIGAVKLNLADRDQVLDAYKAIRKVVNENHPGDDEPRVLLQKMVADGQEVILGAIRDPQFGPVIMFGSGGIEVEGLNDVAFALAPLRRAEAEEMLETTWAGRRMAGYRNLPPGDRDAVIDALLRLGRLVHDTKQIEEIEINPLRVFGQGLGSIAIDVRVRVSRP